MNQTNRDGVSGVAARIGRGAGHRRWAVGVMVLMAGVCSSGALGVDVLRFLGPGSANGVSADGLRVAGQSSVTRGFRWTQSASMSGPGVVAELSSIGGRSAAAKAISADGLVLGGRGETETVGQAAVTWSGPTLALNVYNDMPGGANVGIVNALSGNGMVLAGEGRADSGPVALVWSGGDPTAKQVPTYGGVFDKALASSISRDGSKVGGSAYSSGGVNRPYIYAPAGGIDRPDVSGGEADYSASLNAMSADGLTIGGSYNSAAHQNPYVWSAAEGRTDIALLPGAKSGTVRAISPDGSVAAGSMARDQPGPAILDAFLWDSTNGSRKVSDILVNLYGANLQGYRIASVQAMSDDGRVLVGYATRGTDDLNFVNFTAFVAVIPSPGAMGVVGLGVVMVGTRRRR